MKIFLKRSTSTILWASFFFIIFLVLYLKSGILFLLASSIFTGIAFILLLLFSFWRPVLISAKEGILKIKPHLLATTKILRVADISKVEVNEKTLLTQSKIKLYLNNGEKVEIYPDILDADKEKILSLMQKKDIR
jgi:hypothetical protein